MPGADKEFKRRYLVKDIDRHGNERFYVRRTGARKIRLKSTPGTSRFETEYWAAVVAPRLPSRRVSLFPTNEQSGPVVYFLRAGVRIKIGTSTDVVARIRALQTASNVPLHLLLTLSGGLLLEKAMHDRFEHLRIQGEWFAAQPELTNFLISERTRTKWRNPVPKKGSK